MKTLKIGTLVKLMKGGLYGKNNRGIGIVVAHGHLNVYHVYWPQKGKMISTFVDGLQEVANENG